MVCIQQILQESTKTQQINQVKDEKITIMDETVEPRPIVDQNWLGLMNGDEEPLVLKSLGDGNIVRYPPIFSENNNLIFIRLEFVINVYSSVTGESVRQLVGAPSKIINMEFELKEPNILVACTEQAEVLRWDCRTGELKGIKQLNIGEECVVSNFNLINFYHNSDRAAAFIIYKTKQNPSVYKVVNTSTGNIIVVPFSLTIMMMSATVTVTNNLFKYLVIVNDCYINFVNYKTWRYNGLANSLKHKITAVCFHPTELCVATGDETGQIYLWRNFMDKLTNLTVLYHWHHTPVTSIAFTETGTGFYSSAEEAVLVRWNVEKPEERNFLPRMNGIIRHIAVKKDNAQIAVCTDDNGVQFLDGNFVITHTLQEFTYANDDKTGLTTFPIGLKKNPRLNTLVLNGRVGHLQFFSVHTKRLLYNLNIVNQNVLSMEAQKILYNVRVTKAAFNIDWMATGEVYNDNQHSAELRLKFWEYKEQDQCYELNTNIEMPHEGGFRAMEFSNNAQVDNLFCATVGEDNLIRIWALQKSDNIYRQGAVVWGCVAKTSYKNMPIKSLCFSQDGSLLAAGFGNILCIYTPESLKLKAALNSSAGFDGCAQKARISLLVPNKEVNKNTKQIVNDNHEKLLQIFEDILESNDHQHIKSLNEICAQKAVIDVKPDVPANFKKMLFNKILQMPELNLFQKLQIFQKLSIRCEVRNQKQLMDYITGTIHPKTLTYETKALEKRLHRLSIDKRYKAKYRLEQHCKYQQFYDVNFADQVAAVTNVLGLVKPIATQLTQTPTKSQKKSTQDAKSNFISSLPQPAQITHIQFAAGDYAHLVVVCTRTRLLVWDLLTLRLQSILKISVKHLAFDPQTNLMAAFTHKNDLHIFQPNVPLPIYQRSGLPNLFDLTWVSRRHPKTVSISIDWQSQAKLYMLAEDQTIKYLGSSDDKDDDVAPPVVLKKPAISELQYTTFGTYATKKHTDKESTRQAIGPLIIGNSGKSAVRAITDMSAHTMPPLSLLCADFVKSFVKLTESKSQKDQPNRIKLTNGTMNGHDNYSDSETEESSNVTTSNHNNKQSSAENVLSLRKSILAKSDEVGQNKQQEEAQQRQLVEKRLQHIAKQNLEF